jgi:hypothetical protein
MRRPVRSLTRFRRHHSWKLSTWSSVSDMSGASSASARLRMVVFGLRLECLLLKSGPPMTGRAAKKKARPALCALDGPGIPISERA